MKTINSDKTINTEMEQKYVYISVPPKYYDIAKELTHLLADFGKDIIDDCNYICNKKGKLIIESVNTFQIAITALEINRIKDADVLFNSVKDKLTSYNYKFNPISENNYNIYINERMACLYNKLLYYIANLDSSKFIHCDNICNCDNKFVIKILYLFYSAVANYNIHNYKVSDFLLNYIEAELIKSYKDKGQDGEVYLNNSVRLRNGFLVEHIGCGNKETGRFDVDVSTGNLVKTKESINTYELYKNDLIIKYNK